MPYIDWPLRFAPERAPPFLRALGVTAFALAGAVAVRLAFLGVDNGLALSVTYFPAFIVATLYGGQLWGWTALAASVGLSLAAPSTFATGSASALAGMFTVSGALTVLVSSAFRESLLRLREGQAALQLAQAAQQRSMALTRLAQEVGGFGFWDWDVENNRGEWSTGLYRIYGIDPAENATVRRLLASVHPDDYERARAVNIAAVKEGGMEPQEYRVVWPDGQVRWIMARAEMTRNAEGKVVRAVGVNIDITDQKRADDKIRESEARFRTLANSAPVLMWVSGADGGRQFVNQTYLDFLGIDFDTAISGRLFERVHPDDRERVKREAAAAAGAARQVSIEARFRRADGEWRWLRSISQPRYGTEGEVTGYVGIGYDVTDAKTLEEDLTRINDLLAERIAAALAERDQAEAALRQAQKMEAVGRLTGGVAHDFNNLLTVIMGALDLMQRHPNDAVRRERMIEAALGAAIRGERLTQQLLAFSRRSALRPQTVRVDDLLRESEPLLRRAAGEAVNFTIAPAATGGLACIDPSQFEAALMNLVVNARDAVEAGGSVRVETCLCELAPGDVDGAEAGSYVRVVVHDTGVGMDADVITRVFEPFFTTKEVGKGTGLGLSQVYGFARQSGGGVAIDSAPGKGASVRLYLPATGATAEEALAESPAEIAARGPALRVLLVEDDLPVGDLIVAMLEDLGHEVIRAGSVDDALPILRGERPIDLLLTDLVMPGGRSGIDLAREAVALRPDLPVILSSGYTGDTLSAAAGAPWPLLRKPYLAKVLAQTIEQVLAGASAVDA
jgi:PAS domain S-box-containing protein